MGKDSRTLTKIVKVTTCLLLLSPAVIAEELRTQLTPVATVVSGSLRPLTIVVDGRPWLNRPENVVELQVNGEVIRPQNNKRQSFFTRVSFDQIDFIYRLSRDRSEQIASLILPRLEALHIQDGQVVLKFAGRVTAAHFDGQPITVRDHEGKVRLPPRARGGETSVHTVSLTGAASIKRLYNLRVEWPAQVTAELSADREVAADQPQATSLSSLRLGTVFAIQSKGGKSFAPEIGWTPWVSLDDGITLGADLALTQFNVREGNRFWVATYQGKVGLDLEDIILKLGGGAQTWFGTLGTKALLSLGLQHAFRSPGPISSIELDYAVYLNSALLTHQLRLSVGVRL